jgi:hypothetical protein
MKKFEIKELEKFKEKLNKQLNDLQNKMLEQEDALIKERIKTNRDLEAQVYKMQKLESQQIKSKVELADKIKKKDKELALKNSLIDDYKNQIKQLRE